MLLRAGRDHEEEQQHEQDIEHGRDLQPELAVASASACHKITWGAAASAAALAFRLPLVMTAKLTLLMPTAAQAAMTSEILLYCTSRSARTSA